jgi:hypothetical protein
MTVGWIAEGLTVDAAARSCPPAPVFGPFPEVGDVLNGAEDGTVLGNVVLGAEERP